MFTETWHIRVQASKRLFVCLNAVYLASLVLSCVLPWFAACCGLVFSATCILLLWRRWYQQQGLFISYELASQKDGLYWRADEKMDWQSVSILPDTRVWTGFIWLQCRIAGKYRCLPILSDSVADTVLRRLRVWLRCAKQMT